MFLNVLNVHLPKKKTKMLQQKRQQSRHFLLAFLLHSKLQNLQNLQKLQKLK